MIASYGSTPGLPRYRDHTATTLPVGGPKTPRNRIVEDVHPTRGFDEVHFVSVGASSADSPTGLEKQPISMMSKFSFIYPGNSSRCFGKSPRTSSILCGGVAQGQSRASTGWCSCDKSCDKRERSRTREVTRSDSGASWQLSVALSGPRRRAYRSLDCA